MKVFVKKSKAKKNLYWKDELEGCLHRVDGPAMIWDNGSSFWYLHGKSHREDGPSDIYSSGVKSWFLDDESYSQKEWFFMVLNKYLK